MVRSSHLLVGVQLQAAADGGCLPSGQRTVPSYYDPAEGPWTPQEAAVGQHQTQAEAGAQAPEADEGGGRRRSRRKGAPSPLYCLRGEDAAT